MKLERVYHPSFQYLDRPTKALEKAIETERAVVLDKESSKRDNQQNHEEQKLSDDPQLNEHGNTPEPEVKKIAPVAGSLDIIA